MWILLPLISVFLSINLLGNRSSYCNNNLRLTVILALLLHAAGIFIVTEILSLFNAIHPTAIKVFWGFEVFMLCIITRQQKLKFSFGLGEKIKIYFKEQPLVFSSILFIIGISLFTALFAYPNTWDSMTYHLSRVMYWLQNGNVNHFPTHNDRQIGLSPLAEYCLLQIKCLSAYDPLLNLVQWMAMFGSAFVVSLLTKEAGGNKKTQLLSSFFAVCIPMGILQSNSTQNDYVESFFVVTALLFLIKNIKYSFLYTDIVLFILSCCLAVAAKGTAFIFLVPIVCIWLFYILHNLRWGMIKTAGIGLILVSVFCLPQFVRNTQTFQHPLGADYDLDNNGFGISPTLSNMSKNIAMHFKTPFPELNTGIENGVKNFHNWIGINVNSKNYNWNHSPPFQIGLFSTQEDSAGNALHVLLFFVCFFVYLFRKSFRKNRLVNIILFTAILMFIFFSTLLKWQIWHCRLQLPMFVCIAPFLAYILSEIKSKTAFFSLIILMLNFAGIFLFVNQSRPLFGNESIFTASKTNQYFINNKKLQKPFVEMNTLLNEDSISRIGLITSGDGWQYPFWILQQNTSSVEINQIQVVNDSKYLEEKSPFNTFNPQAVICNNCDADSLSLYYHNITYKQKYRYDNWSLYLQETSPE